MKIHSDLYKYDFIGIVLRFFKIPVRFKNRYVCSFFVADVLEKAHICKFNKKSRFVEPKDFVGRRDIIEKFEPYLKDSINGNPNENT